MSQIIVVGTFHIAEGQQDAAIAAFQDLVSKSIQEPCCDSYTLNVDVEDPRSLVGIEHWSSKAALDAHMQQPYVAELIGKADALLDQPFRLQVVAPQGI